MLKFKIDEVSAILGTRRGSMRLCRTSKKEKNY